MPAKLDKIIAVARQRVSAARSSADIGALTATATQHPPRGFADNLRKVSRTRAAIIAELKQAGAAALSVLTDEQFFQGSLHNLELAACSTHIPCLRKDFIIDELQLLEARACRADAVLLIVAAITQDELIALHRRARELRLDVLCEVHNAAELDRALAAGCDLIGVNNRDLRTFQVNLNTSLKLAARIPTTILKVAESGIESGDDIARLREAGFDAFLIGESLMRASNPGDALRDLLRTSSVTGRP